MLDKENLSTKIFVIENKALFEDVANKYERPEDYFDKTYTQINYDKILNEMCEFLTGYIDYKSKKDDKYKGKVISSAREFYNDMFIKENKYRKELRIRDMKTSFTEFLKGTKRLQDIMEKNVDRSNEDVEFSSLLTMTDNQYRKLSKVCRDDMLIYLWLASATSNIHNYDVPTRLRVDYEDESTPVIHLRKEKKK